MVGAEVGGALLSEITAPASRVPGGEVALTPCRGDLQTAEGSEGALHNRSLSGK